MIFDIRNEHSTCPCGFVYEAPKKYTHADHLASELVTAAEEVVRGEVEKESTRVKDATTEALEESSNSSYAALYKTGLDEVALIILDKLLAALFPADEASEE